tara:strand:+ start:8955 stop:9944 length:990 start_codon:yes stop_codon:yes gene_type:complete
MRKKIAIYEATFEGAAKYTKIFKKIKGLSIITLLDEPTRKCKDDKKFENIYSWSNKMILNFLQNNGVDRVLFFSHRFQDVMLANYLKKNGILCFYVQHGYYEITSMKRTLNVILRKFHRFKTIIQRSQYAIWHFKELLYLFLPLLNHWVFLNNFNKNFINPFHKFFVFNEFWKKQHANIYNCSSDVTYIVGNFDYKNLFESSIVNKKHNRIYICQSLFEDGRIKKSQMMNLISNLKNIDAIKYHPRSIRNFYKNLDAVEINRIPQGSIVIGHYSSLLISAKEMGCDVELVEIPGHEIPNSFLKELSNTKINSASCYQENPEQLIFKELF